LPTERVAARDWPSQLLRNVRWATMNAGGNVMNAASKGVRHPACESSKA